MSGLGARLRRVREHLGETQRSMSDRFSLGINTWQVYERMDRLPKDQALLELVNLGISIDWLITGQGSMHDGQGQQGGGPHSPGPGAGPIPSLDTALLTQVISAVLAVFGVDAPPSPGLPPPGEIIGRVYGRLVTMRDDGERRGALRYALDQLADDLQRHQRHDTGSTGNT